MYIYTHIQIYIRIYAVAWFSSGCTKRDEEKGGSVCEYIYTYIERERARAIVLIVSASASSIACVCVCVCQRERERETDRGEKKRDSEFVRVVSDSVSSIAIHR